MITDKFGQCVFKEDELLDVLMQQNRASPGPFLIDGEFNIDQANELLEYNAFIKYDFDDTLSINEFDLRNQAQWFMPDKYKKMDIAKYILDLCDNQEELQRCGEELLLFQDKHLFDLLRYLVYFVDILTKNNIIWGVGRGSSVASFILYKLKVHKVNSMYYDLHITEFLR
jgi:DNA polymerase III alpha subunit